MPKKAKELSALAVARLKAEGRHAVGGVDGLHLRVIGQSRAWVLRVAVGVRRNGEGKTVIHRRDVGLGSYPEVSLAEAREKARDIRKQVRDGSDPIEKKRQAREMRLAQQAKLKTFRECTEAVMANKRRELKNAKHLWQWEATLEAYAYPVIGGKAVSAITREDVVSILQPLWLEKNETANRLRGRIENVLDYARACGYVEGTNVAEWKGSLGPILGRVRRTIRSQPSLPYHRLPAFLKALRAREGIAARCLELVILTATRSGEVRLATWDEFDLDAALWRIPGDRMKAGVAHTVPLSPQAVALLKAVPRIGGSDFVFPAPRKADAPLSDMALTKLIRDMHEGAEAPGWIDPRENRIATPHGFRSTFRNWAAEQTNYPREACEHALAHKLPDAVEAAYLRTDYLAPRIRLMADWARFCGAPQGAGGDNVISVTQWGGMMGRPFTALENDTIERYHPS